MQLSNSRHALPPATLVPYPTLSQNHIRCNMLCRREPLNKAQRASVPTTSDVFNETPGPDDVAALQAQNAQGSLAMSEMRTLGRGKGEAQPQHCIDVVCGNRRLCVYHSKGQACCIGLYGRPVMRPVMVGCFDAWYAPGST